MRTGDHTVQQTLTDEALSVVKQAVSLAMRRGHAQVTPLHVASTMLTAPNGLFRTACLQSHSHPLQCKALELCFNVALHRLPVSNYSLVSGTHSHHPSVSNALIAAFKRALAHQRRGSIESQQQAVVAVKIELEQLIISILDDPSVSRVMREARFSSTRVKSIVEQAVVSVDTSYQSPVSTTSRESDLSVLSSQSQSTLHFDEKQDKPMVTDPDRNDNFMAVIESFMKKERKSFVVVGESVAVAEDVVQAVIQKVEKRDVCDDLKGVKFIKLHLSSFEQLSSSEVDRKFTEIRMYCLGKMVVLYLGDLKWVSDYRACRYEQGKTSFSTVEQMIMELRKMVFGETENGRVWLLGVSTFQTYMRCKIGYPSLETALGLHPISVPVGNLRLSLVTNSSQESNSSIRSVHNLNDHQLQSEQRETLSLQSSTCNRELTSSCLPPWLQQYKNQKGSGSGDQNCLASSDLCSHWNSISNSVHQQPGCSGKDLAFSRCGADHVKQPFLSNSNAASSSSSSSDVIETEYVQRLNAYNFENLNLIAMCNALEEMVPWQKSVIPEISRTVLQCRSGMVRRKGRFGTGGMKEETWFIFQGVDMEGKEKIARGLAMFVFGSHASNFFSISLSSFSSTRADSTEDCGNKRSREEQSCSYMEKFAEAVHSNPHRVFFVDDVEQSDYWSKMGFRRAIEGGTLTNSNGDEVGLADAIIILSCESLSSRSRACSPPIKQKTEASPCLSLDLNVSVEDETAEYQSIQDIELLEHVDRTVLFKIQE